MSDQGDFEDEAWSEPKIIFGVVVAALLVFIVILGASLVENIGG